MLPPLHKVDGPIEFVLAEDEAWDIDRVKSETADLPPDEQYDHPYHQYFGCETRYDIRQVEHLFREGEKPTIFKLRRMDYHQWRRVEELAQASLSAANDTALVFCLIGVRNGDQNLELRGPESDKRRLTDGDFKKLIDLLGYQRLQDVGAACREASKDLTAREKKASD